jgi:hypothetical protein
VNWSTDFKTPNSVLFSMILSGSICGRGEALGILAATAGTGAMKHISVAGRYDSGRK